MGISALDPALHRPRRRALALPRSIGTKIFAIALALLALLIGVAVAAALMSRQVGQELQRIEADYVPAYAAVARAQVRSLEVALDIRRMALAAASDDPALNARVPFYKARLLRTQATSRAEVVTARRHVDRLLQQEAGFHDVVALARLDVLLEMFDGALTRYEREMMPMLAAIERRDPAAQALQFKALDGVREEINGTLDRIRLDMRAILESATDTAVAAQARTERAVWGLSAVAVLAGLLAAARLTRQLVTPVRSLVSSARAIEGGRLDVAIAVETQDEIGDLATSFNAMAEELRKKERIRDTFGRYMDPRIVQGLIDHPTLARTDGERRVMTILFCDMQGFTALSEQLTPKALVTVINRYLELLSAPVRAHDGVIDKYIGDAIMAYWGPPFVGADEHAALACQAALDMLAALEQFRAELPDLLGQRHALPEISVRIGIATGEVVVGTIGSDMARNYSVLGDSVNLASRLEGANKAYGTRILISAATQRLLGGALATRQIDALRVVGKQQPERVFELLAPGEEATRHAPYTEGLSAYRAGDWAAAQAAFASRSDDPAAQAMLARVTRLMEAPPAQWDGVWSLSEK
jgi:adenylate cyclase